MKIRNFDPIFLDSVEGQDVVFQLVKSDREEIERTFGKDLRTLISDRELWRHVCTHPHKLPSGTYKILSTIQEFGKERFRNDIVSLFERSGITVNMGRSCQYLIAEILLECPGNMEILEAKKLSMRRRRFYRFSLTDEYPKGYEMEDFKKVVEFAAVQIANKRTSLGESVSVSAENLEEDICWQFAVKWCDKIQPTNTYDREKKHDRMMILPVVGDILLRFYPKTGEVDVNMDTRSSARMLLRAMEEMIWNDGRSHFEEVAIYDLNPLADIGEEVLKISNSTIDKIILNMVGFRNEGEEFATRFGENSKTSDVTSCIGRLRDSESIDSAYFTVFLGNGETIKFGIKPPDNLDLIAIHRPFISDIIGEMGLLHGDE
jgi:hypothetical protein